MRRLARVLLAAAVLIGTAAAVRQDAPAPVPPVHANDRVLGRAEAPVTVIQYASFTCHACGDWHELVWPEFKRRFVDSGRVKFVFRNMPTAPIELSGPAAALARCAVPARFFDTADALFDGQTALLRGGDQAQWYDAGVAASGRTRAQIDACVARPEIKTFIEAEIAAGASAGITGTPAFFVNGRLIRDRSLGGLEVAIRTAEGG